MRKLNMKNKIIYIVLALLISANSYQFYLYSKIKKDLNSSKVEIWNKLDKTYKRTNSLKNSVNDLESTTEDLENRISDLE